MNCFCKRFVDTSRNSLYNFRTLTPFSTTSIQNPSEASKNPLVVDHLVNTYGFPRNRAISASKGFSRSASPSSLNVVPAFFKQCLCYTDAQITSIFSRYPQLLSSNVEKTLKPKLNCLEGLGFFGSTLADLIVGCPYILTRDINNSIIPTVESLRSLHYSNEIIVRALKRSNWLFNTVCHNNVVWNVGVLRKSGVSDKQISFFLLHQPKVFTRSPDLLQGALTQVDEFGLKRNSGLFIHAVSVITSMSKATLEGKFKVYKSCGWSELETLSAFRKFPYMLAKSEQNIRTKMGFLTKEVGYDPKDIALKPVLLNYSLEKVLNPRNDVLNILISRGLMKKKPNLFSVVTLSNEKFLQRYVMKYVDEAPDLRNMWIKLLI